jgi:DNA-binding response OmpR family regulator
VQRILVIEHDESIASLLRNGLTANGCTVEVVADGDAAVARVLSEDFDLVILDLGLPDGAAVGVARALQEVNATPSVLVVAKRDDLRDALTEPDR